MKSAALITGASSGIGEEFARRLAAEKRNLFLVARSEDKLRSICSELGGKYQVECDYFPVDLTAGDGVERLVSETGRRRIEVDMLVNNAGFGSAGDFAELSLEKELRIIDLNVSALVALTHAYLGPMRERKRGTIVNVSSAAGFQPVPYMATYAASKAFVTSFSEAIAEENRPYGIQVLALCPGSTKTNFFDASGIDRPIQVKGQESAADVVETAMGALDGKRTKVVSGWTNYLVSVATNFVPNSLITRGVGKALRSKYQRP